MRKVTKCDILLLGTCLVLAVLIAILYASSKGLRSKTPSNLDYVELRTTLIEQGWRQAADSATSIDAFLKWFTHQGAKKPIFSRTSSDSLTDEYGNVYRFSAENENVILEVRSRDQVLLKRKLSYPK